MADPVLTDFFRVQVRVPGKSGLPHDVFVNSFVMRNDTSIVQWSLTDLESLTVNMLTAFYGHLAPFLSPLEANWAQTELRMYDLGQEPPRQPHIVSMPIEGVTAGTGLPAEVALCLSYYAERNLARRRGRVYIGPLNQTAVLQSPTDGVLPHANAREALLAAGADLIQSTENATWCLLSQADAQAFEITNAWVDDAFDTQRRRGREPTSRMVWPPLEE